MGWMIDAPPDEEDYNNPPKLNDSAQTAWASFAGTAGADTPGQQKPTRPRAAAPGTAALIDGRKGLERGNFMNSWAINYKNFQIKSDDRAMT